MMKKFKDPLYGYIEITDEIVCNIIDTAEFQRLRFIIQTSYAPLYPSAVHNRFVHSLGVYHLSRIVSDSFQKFIDNNRDFDIYARYIDVFQYASLLHDIGHAPFSHTGEDFYLGLDSSRDSLHGTIAGLIQDESFLSDISAKNYGAAPHELMSVVVSLRAFNSIFDNDEEKSFFARCILGYPYVDNINEKRTFLNCMISMLNSSVIDIDKLDYLIRDAYITGFDTVSIDYHRLLNNVSIQYENNKCRIVYTNGAISVIEGVVFAHDVERKWIQSHPVVLYDSYLLRQAIERLQKELEIFDYEALTVAGKNLCNGRHISLLSDGDIIFLMKEMINDPYIKEYFTRKDRRHPLWKSEAEYKAIFGKVLNDNSYKKFEDEIEGLLKYLNTVTRSYEINKDAISAIENDISETEQIEAQVDTRKDSIRKQLEAKRRHLKWLNCFRQFAESQDLELDFLFIQSNQFNSGFRKVAFDNIEVLFSSLQKPDKFKNVTTTLSANKSERDTFYYLFYRRNGREKTVDVTALAKGIAKLTNDEAFE